MSLPVLPSPSNFLGVALVINRSRDGPRFVFHYPPHINHVQGQGVGDHGDEDADGDDMFVERTAQTSSFEATGASLPDLAGLKWDQDEHVVTESGTQIVPWEYVAGLPTKDLESILTPTRAYHKKLFQVSLDPLHYVSYPIYVPANGIWKRKKKQRNSKDHKTVKSEEEGGAAADSDDNNDDGLNAQNGKQSPAVDSVHIEKKGIAKSTIEKTAPPDEAEDKVSSMTMFNLVFILNPKKHQVKELVNTMHFHIIRKVNKAYKYCQKHSDFVWKESKRILVLKEKGREEKRRMSSLWNEILSTSSLAASMQDVYDAISQNKIAALQLDTPGGTVTHSVQIPMPFHVSDLPQEWEEDARSLWITTANSFMGDDVVEEPGFLDKNFALLLMEDEKKIMAELQADPDDTTLAMVEFVKHSKPTMSFHQVGQQSTNILTLGQVHKYADHFIFWRRAIAIPPLHARDVYILSPNADMSRLPRASADWAHQFPLAPQLPNFLADLSNAPRPYKGFCPSKAHRPEYLVMLAWLMRGGWVTQLCTFAYVVVWPEIIYEVEYALEAEQLAKAKRVQQAALDELEGSSGSPPGVSEKRGGTEAEGGASTNSPALTALTARSGSQLPGEAASEDDDISNMSTSQVLSPTPMRDLAGSSSTPILTSPAQQAHPRPHHEDHDDEGDEDRHDEDGHYPHHQPTLAEQAAENARLGRIADRAARELVQKASAHARKAPPRETARPSSNEAAHLAHLTPHIILDAKKATGKESLYLSAIQRRLRERARLAAAGTVRAGEVPAAAAGPAEKSAGGKTSSSTMGAGVRHKNGTTAPETKPGAAAGPTTATTTSGIPPAGSGVLWDERVAAAWPVFWKYFNGRSALERVALQEEMKRKDVWNLLTAMSEYLLCVRHW